MERRNFDTVCERKKKVDITLSRTSKYCSGAYNWCCNELKISVTYEDMRRKTGLILYRHVWRDFSMQSGDITNKEDAYAIYYCPFCGTRFPRSLWDDWYSILDEEYHLTWGDEPLEEFLPKLPPEFRSDEWWKKRGL